LTQGIGCRNQPIGRVEGKCRGTVNGIGLRGRVSVGVISDRGGEYENTLRSMARNAGPSLIRRRETRTVIPAVANLLTTTELLRPFRSALGGHIKEATKGALLNAIVQGPKLFTNAMVIDEIRPDVDGKPIEVLFGALAMQQWGIRPIPDEERLDLSHYPKEFVEF
jgi:hypothetical protein